ncbi:MAG: hypothetical protein KIS61_25075 [Candidatus Eremiobacteraeota bacterium]|nr:hypothetical protein [Candidatus Eremiobacteraeota bacterium]
MVKMDFRSEFRSASLSEKAVAHYGTFGLSGVEHLWRDRSDGQSVAGPREVRLTIIAANPEDVAEPAGDVRPPATIRVAGRDAVEVVVTADTEGLAEPATEAGPPATIHVAERHAVDVVVNVDARSVV